MAARRALDHAGLRLSREGWSSLPLESRRRLVETGAARDVDVAAVKRECDGATPKPEPTARASDPSGGHVPETVSSALGASRPLSSAVWSALSPLGRFAL